jgi:uncharacterized protein (DUF1330 family)
MSNKHYAILCVIPTDAEWIEDYIKAVNRLVEKHGGKYLARTASHERLEGGAHESAENGDAAGGIRVIIEWPDKESMDTFYNDPEYSSHKAARQGGSKSDVLSVAGKDDFRPPANAL